MKRLRFAINALFVSIFFSITIPCAFSADEESRKNVNSSIWDKIVGGIYTLCPSCNKKTSQENSEPVRKKPSVEVKEIIFHGNASFMASHLKKIMDTKEKTILHPFQYAPFDEDVLKEDVERLRQFYQSEGFYDAGVTYKVEKINSSLVRIVIDISEGSPVIVRHVLLSMKGEEAKLEKWKEELEGLIPLKEGKIFRTEDYRECEKVVLRYLAEKGHPKAKVETLARVFKEEHNAFAWIDVDIGDRCTFGDLKIEGLQSVNPKEVKRLLTFHKGEVFKASKIKESQKRLWDSQLFSFVDITVQGLDSDETELPVVISLKEAKPYTIKAGAGYGTEDGLRGKVGFEARRFLGDARRLSLQAKASSLTQQLETQFIQPHFLLDPWWLDLRSGVGHNDEKSYETETMFFTPQLNIPITATLRGFVGPNVETNKITKLNIYPYDPTIPERQRDNYFISSLIFGLANEKVDDLLDPRKGFRAFATTEWASDAVGSDINYVKTDLELRTYLPVRDDWIFATRIHWGVISNPEQGPSIPIFKRFFAGGSNSNRGYAYHKLGPLDEWGNALGGRSILEFNSDLRFPLRFITKDIEGVIFFDAGQVFPKEDVYLDELRYAVGAGLRYKTIVGPIRLDLGYALNPPENNPSGAFQFFLSIGQAF